ncbi:hypothetical protein TIFTF001_002097 [Ficus carica]|uniref:Uncharacterized protein n=1 Tax=Ficus carica TaxID=3494 RepID=A0AA87Z345_FICCA|nr:hypothetical protein TIFTF001_002097 [Ficus carica]
MSESKSSIPKSSKMKAAVEVQLRYRLQDRLQFYVQSFAQVSLALEALLQRTVSDYKSAGHDPQSSSLEIRLIQSQDDIRNPQVTFKAERYN